MADDPLNDATRNSTYAAGYAYTLVMVTGLMGLARRCKKTHYRAVIPATACMVLLILFTAFARTSRILIEPVFAIYAGILAGGCNPETAVAELAS